MAYPPPHPQPHQGLRSVEHDRHQAPGAPLGPEERAQADRAGRRLHSELGELLAALPEDARNASGMARHLGIDRTTCQRAVFVASRPYAGLEIFERLPGVRALRALARAAQAAQPAADAELVDALNAAVTHYEQVIASLAGSLTRLAKRIALDAEGLTLQPRPGTRPTEDARLRLFDAARDLTGRSSDCWVAVYIYRPSPSDPQLVEVIRAHGLRAHTARGDAIPLVTHNFATRDGDSSDSPSQAHTGLDADFADGSTVLMDEFTSKPSPLVTARQPGQFLVQAIDTPAGSEDRPIDLMLASRSTLPHPVGRTPAIEEVWALVNFPCRHLLLDVYLHPELAHRSVPSLDAHLWGPDFESQINERWQTRTNDTTPLQLLGAGIRPDAPRAFPRLPQLTEQLFERSKIDPAAYVGFRCDVDYPLWRTGYCITLDFSDPTP